MGSSLEARIALKIIVSGKCPDCVKQVEKLHIQFVCMSKSDKKYLRVLEKMAPGYEVFKEMVKILSNIKTQTNRLLKGSASSMV